MKKIIKISLIVLIIIAILNSFQNVYASSSCKISLQTDKTEYEKGEEIILYVKLSDIQSEKGIISMGMTLDYDKDSLQIVKMEGQNGWDTPIQGSSYNEENGKIVLTKGGLAKSDENVIKITFKVIENSKQSISIGLKDITASDSSLIKIDNISKNITIKEKISNNQVEEQTNSGKNSQIQNDSNSNNKNTNNKNTANKIDNSIKNGTLPKTGDANGILILFIILASIYSIVFYILKRKR